VARIAAFESGRGSTRTEDKARGIADAWQDAKKHAQQKVTHDILSVVPQFLGGNLGRDTSVKTI
jgi:hypothetical protein